MVAQQQGRRKDRSPKRHKATLVGDENVYYPDSGEGSMSVYICKKWIKLYSLNIVVHYTSIVTPKIGENTQLKDRVFESKV